MSRGAVLEAASSIDLIVKGGMSDVKSSVKSEVIVAETASATDSKSTSASNKSSSNEATSHKATASKETSSAIKSPANKSAETTKSCIAGGDVCCGSSCKHDCCGVITRDRKGVFHASAGKIPEELVLESATELEFVLKAQKFGNCTISTMCAASWTLASNEEVIHAANADSQYAGKFVIPTEPGDRLIFNAAAFSPRSQHIMQQSPVSVFIGFSSLRRG